MNIFDYKAKVHLACGEFSEEVAEIYEKQVGNATAVYLGCKAESPIDADQGVSLLVSPLVNISSATAIYKRGEFWLAPHFTSNISAIPDQVQALVAKLEGDDFLVAVPMVSEEYKCIFHGSDVGGFYARIFSWCDGLSECSAPAFVYSIAKRPALAFDSCINGIIEILGTGLLPREKREYPEAFEYLGWCSWDSMQIRVCHEGLIEKAQEFKDKGIPVRWMMIDDMWAEVHGFYGAKYDNFKEMIDVMYSSSLYHFDADPKRFPKGLRGCISELKDMGMQVGIWHPTTGYWHGIDPEGRAYQILKDNLITVKNQVNGWEGFSIPSWEADKSYAYYDTLHSFFRQCGADIVKVDNQSMTRRFYKGFAPVGKIARSFHKGMDASVEKNFGRNIINCMGMSSEDMFNRISSPVCRCSDDFKPEDRAWFTKHILQCAYSSMLQGELYFCDWDMWWTDDGQALKNSVLRAISGGPIYVSDMIGRSRAEILAPLCLSDGKILRCSNPATATYDCAAVNPTECGEAIKVQSRYNDYGIVAAFNIDVENRAVKCRIGGDLVEGFDADEYAVYEHFSGDMKILHRGESFEVTLADNDDFRLYILAPIKNGFAAIGRTDKFISPATVKDVCGESVTLYEEGPYAYVKDGILYRRNV